MKGYKFRLLIFYKLIFQDFFIKRVCLPILIILVATQAWSQAKIPQHLIIIENDQSFKREGEIICIEKSKLKNMPSGFYPLIKKANKTLTSQLIDKDEDGRWDCLLIEVNLNANSKDTLKMEWVKTIDEISFPQVTNIRFSKKSKNALPEKEIEYLERSRGFTQNIADPVYQLEGPGIENDKVAFRSFFDKRNGKDIYGKVLSEPILNRVGLVGSWHKLQDWGMDILRTGNSLGAGGLAVQKNGNLYRLADADKTTFRAIAEGSLYAAFKLNFKKWDAAGRLKNGFEKVSIIKRDYFYKNEIKLSLADNEYLVTGIANFEGGEAVLKNHNSEYSSVFTYGDQADGTKTKLGLAILFPASQYASHATTSSSDSIPNTSYVALKPQKNKTYNIYFIACWEKTDPRFSTKAGFESYIQEVADKLNNPIKTKILYK
ncbi:DUF4861 domain-containing protein [Pedobacter petrophilus]|uniref:DUF4861 domain-containing protein n=2 Tax=Pedobacter TaxID=84567 RepID=A0A7K0G175_9SPHI|nr:DUF4861 family protein [Pedobacter petrophilus]MRX76969.1 DUF4861 domain-containing protein [Pedobacter petrophilus]